MAIYWRSSGYGKVDYEELTTEGYKAGTEMPNELIQWWVGRPRPTTTESTNSN